MIEILDETEGLDDASAGLLKAAAEAFLTEADPGGGMKGVARLTLILLDDERIRLLNQRDRGLDEATDVLSYPAVEPDDEGFPQVAHLGDIFISTETASRQAEAAGVPLLSELLTLFAHGFTHLLGYDHDTEAEWLVFERAQARILELAGLQGSP